jgi:hypothetical protein
MSGNRNEHLLGQIVMKSWCEMSLSPLEQDETLRNGFHELVGKSGGRRTMKEKKIQLIF